jgi:hypothetical protein
MQIKVAKSGKDALTATDPNDFIFHSAYNTFKIIATGTFSPTVPSGGNSHSIAHGQSFIPFVFTFIKFTDSRVGLPGDRSTAVTGLGIWLTKVEVDATNITFWFTNNTSSYVPVLRYYICEAPL